MLEPAVLAIAIWWHATIGTETIRRRGPSRAGKLTQWRWV